MEKLRKKNAIDFIPASYLKSKYDVFGHFYSIEVSRNKIVECRSVLELVESTHTPDNVFAISKRQPDAVFIMMNPGSSRPLVEVDNRIHAGEIHKLEITLVPTKPDTTQYQVMRLMHQFHWRHVRVLNLSDLRCSKSSEFFKQFKTLEEVAFFDSHSIFADRRKTELRLKMTSNTDMPVVVAWGVSDKLDPLIQRCTSRIIRYTKIKGILKEGTTNKYLHPLPSLQKQKVAWVNQMVEHFEHERADSTLDRKRTSSWCDGHS